LFKDLKCKFIKDFDLDKFVVYVPRTVEIEHQISKEIAHKRLNNLPVTFDELPKPRILIHRLILTQREFKAWFDVLEEDVDFGEEESEEFTF
jgi:Ni,Fe-hydrogenase I small subunit